jgi:putative membrane protein
MNPTLAGLISGKLATIPMTLFMEAAHKALPREERQPLPPREITMTAARKAGVQDVVDVPGRKTETTLVMHFAFGATAGMIYSGLAGRTGLAPAAEGALYGLGVWSSNYLGIMPASGLTKHAADDTAGRNALMIAANVLWGTVAAVLFDRLSGRRSAT